MIANAPGARCSSISATCPLAACGPAAPMGTSCGLERAAGSANAIARIASTTVRTTTIPPARIAAGGSWAGDAWCVCLATASAVIMVLFIRR